MKSSNFRNSDERKYEWRKIARTAPNRKLKYIALGCIGVGIILQILMLIFIDRLSVRALLTMRGTAGIFALLFVIVVTIYCYRINVQIP